MIAAITRLNRACVAALAFATIALSCGPAISQDRGPPADQRPSPDKPTLQSGREGGSGGNFDFYILALSWSPSYCAENAERSRDQCATGVNSGFVVHGLWPEYERGRSPQNCDTRSPTRQQIEAVHGLYPDDGLARYEWRVHGTCSGKSPTDYYADVKKARGSITVPAAFTAPKSEQTVATRDIKRAFIDANKGLRLNAMAVTCRSGALQEVRLCLSKDLRQFVSCQQVSRASCRAREITVPPPR